MAAGGAVAGLGLVGLNRLLQQGDDLEKLLEHAIEQMQTALQNTRQAVANAIATQKRLQHQLNQAQTEANNWQQRAQLALQKGDETLAREALIRKKTHTENAATLKAQLDQQTTTVDALKKNLIALEGKISEARTKRNMLKARASAAKANEQLQSTVASKNTGSAMAAFERMEDKVLQMEARSQAAAELAGADLESQFAALESGSNVDDELEAMKAQLLGGSQAKAQLLGTETISSGNPSSIGKTTEDLIDVNLEDLKTKLDQL
ncbi:PspA/IM30 family protein [Kovacikia minuta CCNUW1]|nr:PspA/IM30 family protein [Kovacikia minuta CCNUW1]